jgi:3-phosphoshikimate 1-carboxyvinyltransferase
MKLVAPNGPLNGVVQLPISKSIANRFQIIAALAEEGISLGESIPEDVKVLRNALNSDSSEINIGMAGTAMRFLTAYYSVQENKTVLLTGDERMKQRPIAELVDVLTTLGADIEYIQQEGFPPLLIKGKSPKGGEGEISASVSSQFVSALMMIAPKMKNGLTVSLDGKILSRPYIELTVDCMRQCGIDVLIDENTIRIPAGEYHLPNLEVETDWSAASYFYALAAVKSSSKLLLKGLKLDSPQGDCILADWFQEMGITSVQKENGVEVSSSAEVNFPEELDFTANPDLAQTFAFLAATLGKKLKLTGLDNLRLKETDRVAALKTELEKLGVNVLVDENTMFVSGSVTVEEVQVKTYNDHRMAMSAAVVSFVSEVEIENPEIVTKSFPTFWTQLQHIGFTITE